VFLGGTTHLGHVAGHHGFPRFFCVEEPGEAGRWITENMNFSKLIFDVAHRRIKSVQIILVVKIN
jgi:hypothetical protein